MTFLREAAPVLVPLVTMVAVTGTVVLYLWRRDRQLPLFDAGVITLLVTALYSTVPLLGIVLAGLQWSPISYLPLYLWSPDSREVGSFATRHLVYLCSFAVAYALLRGDGVVPSGPTREPAPSVLVAIAVSAALLFLYFWLLNELFGFDLHPAYNTESFAAAAAAIKRMPYVILQVSHNLYAILFLLKLCVLVWLMSHWDSVRFRMVTVAWLLAEGVLTVTRMGARTWFVLLVLAAGLLYHRLVRPLPVLRAAALATVLLVGALAYGLARDLGGSAAATMQAESAQARWVTMNEFQALFGISYDLHARKAAGLVGPIPAELRASELFQIVPSQILPFAKVDPCVGYPVVRGLGVGCVLGVTAQAIIGLGHVELIVRGLVLALVLALIHAWYVRNHHGYWPTVFYLCMCLWCYYTFRGSTFAFLYNIVYRFVPLLVGVRIVQLLVRRFDRAARACGV